MAKKVGIKVVQNTWFYEEIFFLENQKCAIILDRNEKMKKIILLLKVGFRILKIWQNLKHFAGTLSWA